MFLKDYLQYEKQKRGKSRSRKAGKQRFIRAEKQGKAEKPTAEKQKSNQAGKQEIKKYAQNGKKKASFVNTECCALFNGKKLVCGMPDELQNSALSLVEKASMLQSFA